ncbi:MAG: DUF4956 domain-containing protein [Candidatus Marinimicrobia bacterium]|nr:DUF4956 domain-containing protein [Candidatus Neomarinimicrobiota bacterium]MCF7829571.1 DUF4956 domain-containing protein [Candidatus Neomarinimicrobiota bacterium]MCF7882021.1 DUF4956 domain-containing protein [Candidatus Neomarinimicrobiota bacterium]
MNLFVALICGLLVSVVYRLSYQGPNYSATFVQSSVLLAMITALVIMVIGNNLARAFGLVGAMSIIRFRTAVKDTQDIVFIFFALATGMAAGVGFRIVAFIGTLFIGVVLLTLAKTNYAAPKKREFLIQFLYDDTDEMSAYLDVLQTHCKKHRLVNMQSIGEHRYELSFYVTLRNKEESAELIRRLDQLPQVTDIRFFFDEEPIK